MSRAANRVAQRRTERERARASKRALYESNRQRTKALLRRLQSCTRAQVEGGDPAKTPWNQRT